MSLQSITDFLTEALSDEVPLSRAIPNDSSPHLPSTIVDAEEDATLIIPNLLVTDDPHRHTTSTNVESSSRNLDDFSDHPTVTPQRLQSDRPSIGDWMGTWWVKGKQKTNRPSSILSANDHSPVVSASETSSLSSNPGVMTASTSPNGIPDKYHRRRTAMSVFGTLMSTRHSPTVSSHSRQDPQATDTAPIAPDPAKLRSVSSSPIQSTFPSTPAAPHLTTSLENDVTSSQLPAAPSVTNINEEPRQGTSLRAIANATRVMTSDPASILADQGRETAPLIARLALELVQNARDHKINFRDRPKEKKDKTDPTDKYSPIATLSRSSGLVDAATTLNRALAGPSVTPRALKAKASSIMAPLGTPLFGAFMAHKAPPGVDGPQKALGIMNEPAASAVRIHSSPSLLQSVVRKPASVPLESIIPATSKPPTHYLSRMYTPLTSRNFQFPFPLPNSASRFTIYHDDENQQPLTDRYGFMYDVSQYDVLLLIRAKECGNTAPACLTGVKIADREENNSWPDGADEESGDDAIEIVKGKCSCNGGLDVPASQASQLANSDSPSPRSSTRQEVKSRSSSKSRKRSLTVNSSGASAPVNCNSSILSVTSDTPRHACANTIRGLLGQLTDIHDQRQSAQRKEWNIFVKQRQKVKAVKVPAAASVAQIGGGAAALLGLGTACEEEELSHSEGLINFAQLGLSSNRDERREFDRLVRNGIPLVYRSKVWLECSGGLEMKEPGLFQELLTAGDDQGIVFAEIEKDVGRTMPLNVFFGGDGAGVDKLRRVLRAYSWYGA
jgi:hypothetical protein